jgi:hypothetical protein
MHGRCGTCIAAAFQHLREVHCRAQWRGERLAVHLAAADHKHAFDAVPESLPRQQRHGRVQVARQVRTLHAAAGKTCSGDSGTCRAPCSARWQDMAHA